MTAAAAQIRHDAALPQSPFDENALVLAARGLGLTSRALGANVTRLAQLPLTAHLFGADGQHFVLLRCNGSSALVLEPHKTAPEIIPLADRMLAIGSGVTKLHNQGA
ncbi:hypothetical protein LGM43_23875 [Burkholderia seminalis]|nr:hypothetical protein [Burkholderia seminalis]